MITWPYSKFWLDNNRTDPLRCQNHNKPVVSAMMSNPRKFAEKIALHNQKQAEETAAFEAILRDVSFATKVRRTWPISARNVGQKHAKRDEADCHLHDTWQRLRYFQCSQKSYPQQQHLQLHQNIGTQYRAGSLPNVNQMATNSPIDLPVRI